MGTHSHEHPHTPLCPHYLRVWEEHPDIECFNELIKGKNTSLANGSFEIRIEHAGNIQDWFNNGDVFEVKSGKVFEYNTAGTAMTDLCSQCSEQLKNALGAIQNKTRYLNVVYDGVNTWAGMAQMVIDVTETTAVDSWENTCLVFNRTAALDMDRMSFTYIKWNLDAALNIPELLKTEEQLFLHGAAKSSLASFVTVIGFLVLSMFL